MLTHRNSSAKQTKKSLSSFNSNCMSCSLRATGSGTEAVKRERRRQGGSRGPGTAHPADLSYLEARGLGACHPHLLAGQKEHLQEGGRRGGAILPRAVLALGTRVGTSRQEAPPGPTHAHRQPQALHRELAGHIQLNWFFPLPPGTTELQNHIHQERQESLTEG